MKQCSFWIWFSLAALGSAAMEASGADEAPVANTNTVALDALVAEALERNPELKFYQAEIAAARAGVKSAGKLAPLELDGSVGHKSARGDDNRFLGEGVAWSVGLRQPFDWPGRIGLRKAIANRDVALAELGLARFQSALMARVRSLAYELVVAQQRAAASRTVAGRVRELRDTLVARDPAGLTPLLETRVIEASEVKAEHVAAEAEHRVEHLAIELNYLRGEPPTRPLRVAEASPKFPPAPKLGDLNAAAATNNFELRLRAAEFEQQGFKVALAKHERFQSLTVGPFISEERSNDRERIIGLSVSVPLPLWQQNRPSVEAASARRLQAEADLDAARRKLERDVADAWHEYEHAIGVLAKWRPDAIEHFREAAEVADRHYRLGAVPVSTYVELQRQYGEAVEALLDARREALEAAHQIELFTGLALPVTTTSGKMEETK
jgi:cobalt-zinc-cadmium efflux system outer membrane protein